VSYWVFAEQGEMRRPSGPLSFLNEDGGHWWHPDPAEAEPRQYEYREGDIAYLSRAGELGGWGTVSAASCWEHFETDGDEEGHTPPLFVRESWTVTVQPRVIFADALRLAELPEDVATVCSLSESEAQAHCR